MASHILPDTSKRVVIHTKHKVNETIRKQTIDYLTSALKEDKNMITLRINKLDM